MAHASESGQRTIEMETPDCIDARVFHEEDITPGAICRRCHADGDEVTFSDWFAIVSTPKTSDHGAEYVEIVWLDGDDAGKLDRYFLRDLGVKPPYRAVCEKHSLEIPERFIAKRTVFGALARWLL